MNIAILPPQTNFGHNTYFIDHVYNMELELDVFWKFLCWLCELVGRLVSCAFCCLQVFICEIWGNKETESPRQTRTAPGNFFLCKFFFLFYLITFFHSAPKLEQSTQITTATHPSLFWIFILILNWNSLPVKYILSVPDKNRENSTLECYKIQPTRYGKCQPSQIFVLLYECLRGERHINNSIWSASCQWEIIILIIIIITSPSLSWSSSS